MSDRWMDNSVGPMRSGYDTMQVCLNGHRITSTASTAPQFREDHCSTCGARTILACENCKTPIRGFYHTPGVVSLSEPDVPQYCPNCGSAYPWRRAAIENLQELLRESGLDEHDIDTAEKALPDVLRDTPKTKSATMRLKRILTKLQKPAYELVIKVISDVASETAKKVIGLG